MKQLSSAIRSTMATACVGLMIFNPSSLYSQQPSGQGAGATATQPSTASPAAGITNGTAPIETTLFAYRALASDADAVSRRVAGIVGHDKVVIGSSTDVAAFTQWRIIIGQTRFLTRRAREIHNDLTDPGFSYTPAMPLAALSINSNHVGNFIQGLQGTYTVTVSNSAAASQTVGRVTVTENLPDGLTLSSMSGPRWDCTPLAGAAAPSKTCRTDDSLAAGAIFPPITVTVAVASNAPSSVTNSVTVAGGGSAPATATDPTAINLSRQAAAPPNRFGAHLNQLQQQAESAGGAQAQQQAGAAAAAATPPVGPFSAALTAIPVFTALAQFLATAFAVNQTLSPSQGSMTDPPLINAVAQNLRSRGVTVFVPSVYPPNLLNGKSLQTLYLWRELNRLEFQRIRLWSDIGLCSASLMQAAFVTQNPTKYSATDLNLALAYSARAQSLLASAQATTAAIDSFEASLFGGQATPQAQSAPATAAASPASASASSAGSTSPAPSASSQGTAAPIGATGATGANQLNPATQPTAQPASSPANSAAQTAISLQQIVASDLLAQRIWDSHPEVTEADMNSVNFLTVHALESGGSQINKTNLFYGTHIFFSGGSVMTFSLYKSTGDLTCSGFAYNYRGNVREKDYEVALRDLRTFPAALSTDYGCAANSIPQANSAQITSGMTVAQVETAIGPPDVKFEADGTNYVYKARGIVVVFKRGKVVRVVGAY